MLVLLRILFKLMVLIIEYRLRNFKGILKIINYYYNIEIFIIEIDYL